MNIEAIRKACESILAEIDEPSEGFSFTIFSTGTMFVEQARTERVCPPQVSE